MHYSIKRRLEDEINKHFVLYLIIFFVFCAGVIAGMYSLDVLNSSEKQTALNYVNSSFGVIKETTLSWYDVFKNSLYNNALLFLPLIISGLFTLTIPFAFVIICAKGYLLGFSILFILSGYKFFGLFVILLCIILPSLITMPCYFLMAKIAVLNGISKIRRIDIPQTNKDIMLSMRGYISDAIMMCLFLCVALLIEAVIMPIIMSYILRLY